jgi:uncharacterized NAD-dependent epimerase/dehydratase family protein
VAGRLLTTVVGEPGKNARAKADAMLKHPYLLFVGNAADRLAAKTAVGILQWRRDWCLGQTRLPGCRVELDLPDMTPEQAAAAGAGTMIVGVANAGGFIPEAWTEMLVRALRAGLDLASGLHDRLVDIPAVRDEAARLSRSLYDVRHPTRSFAVGTGEPRSGKRLLTVGTDCSVGKMYASLALVDGMRARGLDADFRATGQTGIFIAGDGVSVDAVVADFIAGATEWLSPAADPGHWDVIEGQGSLFHPSYAGVSLGLLHGAQPDALVMCHEPTRTHMRGLPNRALPDLLECIAANEQAARLTNPRATCIGVCVNTSALDAGAAATYLAELRGRTNLPCVDPLIHGVDAVVDRMI